MTCRDRLASLSLVCLAALAACVGNVHVSVDGGHGDASEIALRDGTSSDTHDVATTDAPTVDVASPCAPGQAVCGSGCVNLAADSSNCGACGHACTAQESCVSAACACVSGTTSCGGACVDTATDPSNCGTCGHACPSTMSCSGGACTGPSCAGAACISPATCPAGTTEVTFVSQVVPGPTIAPSVPFDVSVTFANCGTRTWTAAPVNSPSGFKLGSEAPRDNTTWGISRVALPADVPPGSSVQIPIHGQSPAAIGFYQFSWGIVNEGVAWLTGTSPVAVIVVDLPPRMVPLCTGVMVDVTGHLDATIPLQQCINATPAGGTLDLPAGVYRMDGQATIDHAMTLRTTGLGGAASNCLDPGVSCAILRAAGDINVTNGLLALVSTSSAVIDHVVIDGNRAARLSSPAAGVCAGGNNRVGFNATASNCANCSFVGSASINALCGTGFEWTGADATIMNSAFLGNGDHAHQNMWSDGLTLLQSDRAHVTGNRFENNSDVSFISGGARDGVFQNNTFQQATQTAFAGFMMDNFNGGTSGDFTGTVVSGNQIDCTTHQCDFGIEIGPHAWYLSANTIGGTVTANIVYGAKQGLNAEGGGTTAAPVRVFGNTITGSGGSASFNCGTRTTSNMNLSPDSHVDRNGETGGATGVTWHGCP